MRRLQKIWSIVLACIFTFSLCAFSSCIRVQELKLDRIKPQGNYIFRSGLFFNQGNTVVNIRDKARKKIMREKFVIADTEHLCEMPYFEKDGMVYFIICYRETNMAYNEETENYERDNYFAFGCSPLFNGKATISDYFMLHEQTINGVGLFGDYAVFEIEETNELVVYKISTLSRVEFDMDGYVYEESEGETFMLEKTEDDLTYYRIYDKDLSCIEISNATGSYSDVLYKDYVLFYDNQAVETTISAINYKTEESLTREEAFALYSECQADKIYYHISYNGRKYTYEREKVTECISTGTFDENGQEIYKYNSYLSLVLTDVETKEEYATTNLKLLELAPQMQEIQEIYRVKTFDSVGVCSQDGELFFIFWNEAPFFGMTTYEQSPYMMFKYDADNQSLIYIGFSYRFPTHIYEGTL